MNEAGSSSTGPETINTDISYDSEFLDLLQSPGKTFHQNLDSGTANTLTGVIRSSFSRKHTSYRHRYNTGSENGPGAGCFVTERQGDRVFARGWSNAHSLSRGSLVCHVPWRGARGRLSGASARPTLLRGIPRHLLRHVSIFCPFTRQYYDPNSAHWYHLRNVGFDVMSSIGHMNSHPLFRNGGSTGRRGAAALSGGGRGVMLMNSFVLYRIACFLQGQTPVFSSFCSAALAPVRAAGTATASTMAGNAEGAAIDGGFARAELERQRQQAEPRRLNIEQPYVWGRDRGAAFRNVMRRDVETFYRARGWSPGLHATLGFLLKRLPVDSYGAFCRSAQPQFDAKMDMLHSRRIPLSFHPTSHLRLGQLPPMSMSTSEQQGVWDREVFAASDERCYCVTAQSIAETHSCAVLGRAQLQHKYVQQSACKQQQPQKCEDEGDSKKNTVAYDDMSTRTDEERGKYAYSVAGSRTIEESSTHEITPQMFSSYFCTDRARWRNAVLQWMCKWDMDARSWSGTAGAPLRSVLYRHVSSNAVVQSVRAMWHIKRTSHVTKSVNCIDASSECGGNSTEDNTSDRSNSDNTQYRAGADGGCVQNESMKAAKEAERRRLFDLVRQSLRCGQGSYVAPLPMLALPAYSRVTFLDVPFHPHRPTATTPPCQCLDYICHAVLAQLVAQHYTHMTCSTDSTVGRTDRHESHACSSVDTPKVNTDAATTKHTDTDATRLEHAATEWPDGASVSPARAGEAPVCIFYCPLEHGIDYNAVVELQAYPVRAHLAAPCSAMAADAVNSYAIDTRHPVPMLFLGMEEEKTLYDTASHTVTSRESDSNCSNTQNTENTRKSGSDTISMDGGVKRGKKDVQDGHAKDTHARVIVVVRNAHYLSKCAVMRLIDQWTRNGVGPVRVRDFDHRITKDEGNNSTRSSNSNSSNSSSSSITHDIYSNDKCKSTNSSSNDRGDSRCEWEADQCRRHRRYCAPFGVVQGIFAAYRFAETACAGDCISHASLHPLAHSQPSDQVRVGHNSSSVKKHSNNDVSDMRIKCTQDTCAPRKPNLCKAPTPCCHVCLDTSSSSSRELFYLEESIAATLVRVAPYLADAAEAVGATARAHVVDWIAESLDAALAELANSLERTNATQATSACASAKDEPGQRQLHQSSPQQLSHDQDEVLAVQKTDPESRAIVTANSCAMQYGASRVICKRYTLLLENGARVEKEVRVQLFSKDGRQLVREGCAALLCRVAQRTESEACGAAGYSVMHVVQDVLLTYPFLTTLYCRHALVRAFTLQLSLGKTEAADVREQSRNRDDDNNTAKSSNSRNASRNISGAAKSPSSTLAGLTNSLLQLKLVPSRQVMNNIAQREMEQLMQLQRCRRDEEERSMWSTQCVSHPRHTRANWTDLLSVTSLSSLQSRCGNSHHGDNRSTADAASTNDASSCCTQSSSRGDENAAMCRDNLTSLRDAIHLPGGATLLRDAKVQWQHYHSCVEPAVLLGQWTPTAFYTAAASVDAVRLQHRLLQACRRAHGMSLLSHRGDSRWRVCVSDVDVFVVDDAPLAGSGARRGSARGRYCVLGIRALYELTTQADEDEAQGHVRAYTSRCRVGPSARDDPVQHGCSPTLCSYDIGEQEHYTSSHRKKCEGCTPTDGPSPSRALVKESLDRCITTGVLRQTSQGMNAEAEVWAWWARILRQHVRSRERPLISPYSAHRERGAGVGWEANLPNRDDKDAEQRDEDASQTVPPSSSSSSSSTSLSTASSAPPSVSSTSFRDRPAKYSRLHGRGEARFDVHTHAVWECRGACVPTVTERRLLVLCTTQRPAMRLACGSCVVLCSDVVYYPETRSTTAAVRPTSSGNSDDNQTSSFTVDDEKIRDKSGGGSSINNKKSRIADMDSTAQNNINDSNDKNGNERNGSDSDRHTKSATPIGVPDSEPTAGRTGVRIIPRGTVCEVTGFARLSEYARNINSSGISRSNSKVQLLRDFVAMQQTATTVPLLRVLRWQENGDGRKTATTAVCDLSAEDVFLNTTCSTRHCLHADTGITDRHLTVSNKYMSSQTDACKNGHGSSSDDHRCRCYLKRGSTGSSESDEMFCTHGSGSCSSASSKDSIDCHVSCSVMGCSTPVGEINRPFCTNNNDANTSPAPCNSHADVERRHSGDCVGSTDIAAEIRDAMCNSFPLLPQPFLIGGYRSLHYYALPMLHLPALHLPGAALLTRSTSLGKSRGGEGGKCGVERDAVWRKLLRRGGPLCAADNNNRDNNVGSNNSSFVDASITTLPSALPSPPEQRRKLSMAYSASYLFHPYHSDHHSAAVLCLTPRQRYRAFLSMLPSARRATAAASAAVTTTKTTADARTATREDGCIVVGDSSNSHAQADADCTHGEPFSFVEDALFEESCAQTDSNVSLTTGPASIRRSGGFAWRTTTTENDHRPPSMRFIMGDDANITAADAYSPSSAVKRDRDSSSGVLSTEPNKVVIAAAIEGGVHDTAMRAAEPRIVLTDPELTELSLFTSCLG